MFDSGLYNTTFIFKERNDIKFQIPIFQRRFSWNAEHVKNMFEDFSDDSNDYNAKSISKSDGYLLGNIVLIQVGNEPIYEVVDGQQRLTTLTLIYKSIANRYKKMSKEATNNDDYEDYMDGFSDAQKFYYFNRKEKVLRIKHNETLSYSKTYKNIMNGVAVSNIEINNSIDKNMYEAWNEINKQIDKMTSSTFINFDNYLQNNVFIIRTVCNSKDQALQLFEVLNNRGEPLEQIDLIKNMLLQKVNSKDINVFEKYWKNFSENLYIKKNNKGNLNDYSTDFLKYFIMANYGENVNKARLVGFFRKQIRYDFITSDNVINMIKKLSDYSDIFKTMIQDPKNNSFSKSSLIYSLTRLNLVQFHQLLMMFYFNKKVSKNELQIVRERVLLECVKMGISNINSSDYPNEIEKMMPKLVKTFKDHIRNNNTLSASADSMIKIMHQYNKSKCDEIRSTLPTKKLSQKNAINLLKIIEIIINKNEGIIVNPPNDRAITLEHILPQNQPNNINELGFSEDDEYSEVINRIGNLTLLRANDNAALQDKKFKDKKESYGKTDIIMTKAINGKFVSIPKSGNNASYHEKIVSKYEISYSSINIWSKECILKRGEELTKLVTDFIIDKI